MTIPRFDTGLRIYSMLPSRPGQVSLLETVEPRFGIKKYVAIAMSCSRWSGINEFNATGATVRETLVRHHGIGVRNDLVCLAVIQSHRCVWGPFVKIVVTEGQPDAIRRIVSEALQEVSAEKGEGVGGTGRVDRIEVVVAIEQRHHRFIVRSREKFF